MHLKFYPGCNRKAFYAVLVSNRNKEEKRWLVAEKFLTHFLKGLRNL